jgi:hypothetical protein
MSQVLRGGVSREAWAFLIGAALMGASILVLWWDARRRRSR